MQQMPPIGHDDPVPRRCASVEDLRGRDEPRCDGWPVLDFRKPTMTTLIVGTPSGAIGHEGDDP
jgi:hypothetical protein